MTQHAMMFLLSAGLIVGACGRSASIDAAEEGSPVTPKTTAAASRVREVTIPAGTEITITLTTAIGSDTSHVEDPVRASVASPVVIDGLTAVPQDSELVGTVTSAVRPGRVKGRAEVAFRLDALKPKGSAETYTVRTGLVTRRAPATKGEDAAKIVLPAAGGAIVGGIAGGKKGAAIGTAVGGGAGTAVVMSSRGKEIRLAPGTRLKVALLDPLTVRIARP